MLLEPEEFVDEGEDASALRAPVRAVFLARRGAQANGVAVVVQVGRALEVDAEDCGVDGLLRYLCVSLVISNESLR